jgi:DNA-directed RNA polymerase specialized sigma24 family protein
VIQANDTGGELYRRFLDGDEKSFTALVNSYKDALIGFIAAIIRDETDAEDVAIDAFAVLMSRRKRCNV